MATHLLEKCLRVLLNRKNRAIAGDAWSKLLNPKFSNLRPLWPACTLIRHISSLLIIKLFYVEKLCCAL